ncbi:dienelactone hydrolase endo- -beta-d-glucanase [Moniliophthora roreri MCA 2997]|uniref:Dienelactone hydrolase endo--beta-d-glucanase n=1 Tax=Moniliophthora roreri (strain MCA 2997) TaxID=1381753 RepID=V2WD58_MONRO|nr:dienelactone hydrolase endo- -beta-d-glucanase [Moniliophthora roreri MCA 2997]
MSFCKDCVKGVVHEGTPTGKWEKIGGVDCYVAIPSIDYPKDKVLLYLADVFGVQLPNAQLLVDSFAENGFKTIAPDYLNGDPIPADALFGKNFDPMKWFVNHGADKTRPTLDKVIEALKAEGITAFGATGYCFGGRYVFDLAFENIIKVGATSHPSLLQVPADLEKYVSSSKAPLLINSCTIDEQFPPESQAKADEVFKSFAPGYKREYFDGCVHGFAVRGDLSDPKVKAGKEATPPIAIDLLADSITPDTILRKACPDQHKKAEEILQSSFQYDEPIIACSNGLVNALSQAYNQHHAISTRPDDV